MRVLITFFFFCLAAYCVQAQQAVTSVATAYVRGAPFSAFPNVQVNVRFEQSAAGGDVNIFINATGFPAPGTYAMHVHQYGDVNCGQTSDNPAITTSAACVGTHFNPLNTPHGCFPDVPRHAGDLGNLTIVDNTVPTLINWTRSGLDLSMTNLSVIGRAVVIHSGPDQCVQPTGAAGTPIAQGVIGISNFAGNTADNRLTENPTSASVWMYKTLDQSSLNISGALQFHAVDGAPGQSWVRVVGSFSGLTPGNSYGIHVHQYGEDYSNNGVLAGSHYDPYLTARHAYPFTTYRHMGDIGNITANATGVAVIDQVFNLLTLIPNCFGVANIIGRGVVLHAGFDDGVTQPTGNSGARWMVGTIGISGRTPPTYTPPVPATPAYAAKAIVRGSAFPLYSNFSATVTFSQDAPGSLVTINIIATGFPAPGDYAWHIHTWGDVTSGLQPGTNITTSSLGVGPHFNPLGAPHGCFPDPARHAGDLGNLTVTDITVPLNLTVTRDLFDLGRTNLSVIGRALVIHSGADLCVQPNGAAGTPMAQGVIGITNVPNQDASLLLPSLPTSAVAVLRPTASAPAGFNGQVQFSPDGDNPSLTRVIAGIYNLPPNWTGGIHVHWFGDESAVDGSAAGGHLDGYGAGFHAHPYLKWRHQGDIGNITSDANGFAFLNASFDLLALMPDSCRGPVNILGRAVVLHAARDDGVTQPTGASGARWAVGTIGVSARGQFNPLPPVVSSSSSTGAATSSSSSSSSGAAASSSSSGAAASSSSSGGGAASSSSGPANTSSGSNSATNTIPSMIVLAIATLFAYLLKL